MSAANSNQDITRLVVLQFQTDLIDPAILAAA